VDSLEGNGVGINLDAGFLGLNIDMVEVAILLGFEFFVCFFCGEFVVG
jgi:hypothetical protein